MQARVNRNATRVREAEDALASLEADHSQRLAEVEARLAAYEEAVDATLHATHDRIAERAARRRTIVVDAEPAMLARVTTDIPAALGAAFEASDGPSYAGILQRTEAAIKADKHAWVRVPGDWLYAQWGAWCFWFVKRILSFAPGLAPLMGLPADLGALAPAATAATSGAATPSG